MSSRDADGSHSHNPTSKHRFQDRRQQRMRGAGTQQPVARTFSFKPMGASTSFTSTNQAPPPTAATASTSKNPKPINPTASSSSSSNPSLSSSARRSSSNVILARPSWGGKVGSGVLPASSPPNQDTDGDESLSGGRSMRPAPIQSKPTTRSAVEEASIQPTPKPSSLSSRILSSSSGVKSSSNNPLRSAMRGGRASHAAQEVDRTDSFSPSKSTGSKRPNQNGPSTSTPISKPVEPARKKARISDVFQRKEISDYGSEEEDNDDPNLDQDEGEEPPRISAKEKGKGKAVDLPAVKSKATKAAESEKRKSLAKTNASTTNGEISKTDQSKSKSSGKTNQSSKENQNKKSKSSLQSKLPFAKSKPPIKSKSKSTSSTVASTSKKILQNQDDDDDEYADDSIQSLSLSRPRTSSTSLAELQRGISNAQRRAMAKRLRRVVSLGLERDQEEIVEDDEEAEKQFIRDLKSDGGREWISKEEKKWKKKLNDADVLWSVLEKGLKEAGASTPTSSSITFFRSLRHSLHSKFTNLSSLSSTRSSLINQLKRARKVKRERRKKVWRVREEVLELEREREEDERKELDKKSREEDIKFANVFLQGLENGAREWA